jgi:hypothetical protein
LHGALDVQSALRAPVQTAITARLRSARCMK